MKRQFLLIVFFMSFMLTFGQNWTKITSDSPKDIQYQLLSSSEDRIVLEFSIPGFYKQNVETPMGKQAIISVPEMVSMLEKAAPDLPIYALSSIIGNTAKMDARLVSSEYTDYQNIEIAPSKGNFSRQIDPATVPYTYGSMYKENAFYPATTVFLQKPYILRDLRGQAVSIQPFSYNPVTKTLRVFHHLIVELVKTGEGGENQITTNRSMMVVDPEFKQLYSHHFVNYDAYLQRYPAVEEEGNMLVISYGPFMDAMAPFVAWKKTIGRPIEIVDVATIGSTPAAIKAYISNYYNTNGLTYVLLVGDHEQVPSYNNTSSGGYSDNYYAYLEGSDSYNELFVGRFSAETVAHVETQVSRIITYERDMTADVTWIDSGMGVSRNEGAGNGHNGGEADYQHIDFIRDSLLNFTYSTVYQEYDGNCPGIPNTSAAMISQRINDGVSIISYCNHGSQNSWSVGGYSTSHVDALTNTDRWPIVWAVACDNGRFTGGTCFAETWLRATDNGEPAGAIGTMMSWISQPWQPPMTGQDEMVTLLVEGYENNIKRTFGGCSINGSMKMIDLHGSSGQSTHDTWILFGDPSLTLRTANPTNMTVSHLPSIFIGMNELTVNADAEDAIVALTRNGEILGTAYIQNGTATVGFPELTEIGMIDVAVFGFNRVTYLGQVEIIPAAGPFIGYVSCSVNDASGNNNGLIDFNESILLGMSIGNMGVAPATNVNITLSTESEYFTITDATHDFGTIQPDQTVNLSDAFAFTVADNIPDNTVIQFNMVITSNESNWESNFSLTAHAPLFTLGSYTVSDPTGNNNGRLDPGETVDLQISIQNSGSGASNEALVTIGMINSFITVNNNDANFTSIGAGATVIATFNLTISPTAPVGTTVDFTSEVVSGNYVAEKSYSTKIGLILEDFETGDFSAFDWTNGGSSGWIIQASDVFEGAFSAKSGAIVDNQNSILSIDYEVSSDDTLSFYRKVSSESGYDFMRFYIDNVKLGEWSGVQDWERFAYVVAAGPHTFKWEYSKDVSVAEGSDAAYVDYINFPAQLVTSGYAGSDAQICSGNSYRLNGNATHYNSLEWSTSGDGNFSDPAILNPIYTPGANDITNGTVDLMLKVTGNTSTIESVMHLTIHPLATASVGGDVFVCKGETYSVVNAEAQNFTSIHWQTSGSGNFDQDNILLPTYSPSAADYDAGSVTLSLVVVGNADCGEVSDSFTLNFNNLPGVIISGNNEICFGQSTPLMFELTGQSPWTVEMNTEILTITETLFAKQVSPEVTSTYSLVNVSDGNGCSQSVSGEVQVIVNFAPATPANPILPETVDYAYNTGSNFQIETMADATSYLCTILPENAGNATITNNEVQILWNTNYTGIATVSIAAVNLCGNSDWSSTEVQLKNTLGMNELSSISFSIFPNPATDKIRLQIVNQSNEDCTFSIVNILGEIVYSEIFTEKGTHFGHETDLSFLSNGVYKVLLSNGETRIVKNLVIKH